MTTIYSARWVVPVSAAPIQNGAVAVEGQRIAGVGPETLVGICLERSTEMVIGLLGILKAGAAYVPLDPSYPSERLRLIVAEAGISVVLTMRRFEESLSAAAVTAICLDADWNDIAGEREENERQQPQEIVPRDIFAQKQNSHPGA